MGHREQLLEAAIRCLHEKGYARTTARDLVAESGANLASIGYHYGSKEALLNEALSEAFHRSLDPLIEMWTQPGPASPLERLVGGLGALREWFDRNRGLAVAWAEALAQVERAPELRAQIAASYERFRSAIVSAVEAVPGGDRVDARGLASFVLAISDGLVIQWMVDPERVPDGERMLRALAGGFGLLAQARPADADAN